jgi:hypothetical protein
VYFPPLAWQLAGTGSSLLNEQGWADATGWLAVSLAERADIAVLCPSLPIVLDPTHDPAIADRVIHFFSDELTPIVECSDLTT